MAYVDNFGYGVDGASYAPTTYEELGDAIGKVAKQIIRDVGAVNPMERFDKGMIENGDTIETAVVKLVEAQGYDKTGANALSRDTTSKLAVRYFNKWQRHTYKTTVDIQELRKILLNGGEGSQAVAERLVGALGASAMDDRFQAYKRLIKWGTTTASWSDNTNPIFIKSADIQVDANGNTQYKAILKQIKDIVKGMQFVNTNYNRAGLKRKTLESDIIIVMPYKLKNAIDVDELAGVFNLSKAEIANKIIEVDTDDKIVYVLDQNAVLHYVRLYEMAQQKNASGLFFNYFLHVEDMYGLSPLFDATFFNYDVPNK